MSKSRKLVKNSATPKEESLPSNVIVPTNADVAITMTEFDKLKVLFDFLNVRFFNGELPDPLFNYIRKPHMLGHFAANRYASRSGPLKKSEIGLNPDSFPARTDKQIASTVLHEMTHVAQHKFGTPGARGYHNKEWARMMQAVGLMPSNTGAVGGRQTGQQMSHFIIPDGLFDRAFDELAATGWKLDWQSAIYAGEVRKKNDSHTKFICPVCGWIVRGKPDTEVVHKPCGCDMLLERPADQSSDQSLAEAAE